MPDYSLYGSTARNATLVALILIPSAASSPLRAARAMLSGMIRGFPFVLLFSCALLPLQTGQQAIEVAKSERSARTKNIEGDYCKWKAVRRGEFWVVQETPDDAKLDADGVIGTDCFCAHRIYVDPIRGKALCALCGHYFNIERLDGRESCDPFLDNEPDSDGANQ